MQICTTVVLMITLKRSNR